jgi:tRNA1(Val) A37 N6-methylase TrmN6
MTEALAETTTDAFLGGNLVLRQPKRGHRAGHDAILLAAATAAKPGDRVIEFGAGVGAAGLALARRIGGLDLTLVEINAPLAALAHENAMANAIAANVLTLDVAASAAAFEEAGLHADSADAVLMNPPFNDAGRHRASSDQDKRLAHVAIATTLEEWVHAARRVLKSGGALTLIWRADGLTDVLAALGRGFGSLAIMPVHPDLESPAIRVLVRAIKGGRAPMEILPALVLNDAAGLPAAEAQDVLTGRAALSLVGRRS